MDNWSFKKIDTTKVYSLPAGYYYIGDICYVLDDDIYDNVFGGTGYKSGLYTSALGQFLVNGTYAGDGSYPGTDGFSYAVDAGVIGIVSKSLIATDSNLGKVYNFPTGVNVTMGDGLFTFESKETSFEINTRDDADE